MPNRSAINAWAINAGNYPIALSGSAGIGFLGVAFPDVPTAASGEGEARISFRIDQDLTDENGNLITDELGNILTVSTFHPRVVAGTMGSARSNVSFGADLDGFKRAYANGVAKIDIFANLFSGFVLYASGEADVVVDGQADVTAHKAQFLSARGNIDLDSDLALNALLYPGGLAEVQINAKPKEYVQRRPELFPEVDVDSNLDIQVANSVSMSSLAYIRLSSRFFGKQSRSVALSGRPLINVAGFGSGNLMAGLSGTADAYFDALMGSRFGGKVQLQGKADIDLAASMETLFWRHVYSSGHADIVFELLSRGVGLPPIPDHYVPAHPRLKFYVARENRTFIVPKDRRRLR